MNTAKRVIVLTAILAILLPGAVLFGETLVGSTFSTSTSVDGIGEWEISRGRLYQNDTDERLAKVNLKVPQSGIMQYEFDLRYEGGGYEDYMGGFGLQVFVDEAAETRSWGNGESYLLWLNY